MTSIFRATTRSCIRAGLQFESFPLARSQLRIVACIDEAAFRITADVWPEALTARSGPTRRTLGVLRRSYLVVLGIFPKVTMFYFLCLPVHLTADTEDTKNPLGIMFPQTDELTFRMSFEN